MHLGSSGMVNIRWQTISTSNPCSCLTPCACPSSLLMWPVIVSFLLWLATVSSCYPLAVSLFLFLIVDCAMRTHFSTLLLCTGCSDWLDSDYHFFIVLRENMCYQSVWTSVYALGLDKSAAFDSNLEYFSGNPYLNQLFYLRPWNMYVKFHI